MSEQGRLTEEDTGEALRAYLRRQIMQHGPMDIGQFMGVALGHPQWGYYMKQDPFGAAGDFTTAPEISQMFGEVIGAWVADVWLQMGAPERFSLLECGPGRGTLMADILRAARGAAGFADAVRVHFLEISPVLKAAQGAAVAGYDPQWHETLDSVPDDAPLIVVGNEFLDALPLRQLVRGSSGWKERVVALGDTEAGAFVFGLRGAAPLLLVGVPDDAPEGSVWEISPARSGFVGNLADMLKRCGGGAALLIDYGHAQSGVGDTFQALYRHEYVDVLSHIGDADLTSHVDFAALARDAVLHGVAVSGIVEQGAFLERLGIGVRAQSLMRRASEQQARDIETALHRLTHSDQMGSLFKVMGIHYGYDLKLAGF